MIHLSILGSTGSIGTSTLDVVSKYSNTFNVVALAAKNNIRLLENQARRFRPQLVAVWNEEKAKQLRKILFGTRIKVVHGLQGLVEVATIKESRRIVFSLSGIQGLTPLIEAIKKRKDIAIANKELLVIAGTLIKKLVVQHKVKFVPIDSEHSAIFQCLHGNNKKYLKRILITASGGPLIDYSLNALKKVTPKEALRHPRWKMGKKISIDSATMMNKGLEVIEAAYLYDVDIDTINIIIHRESIIHSLVEFIDGSFLAQLSTTDMRFPIIYALTYPERIDTSLARPNLAHIRTLSFEDPNFNKFPCLKLAYSAGKIGGTMPVVLNAAHEVAVESFLQKKIAYLKISKIIQKIMKKHTVKKQSSVEDIMRTDTWARQEAIKLC